jgi:hypothetical protein
MAFAALAEPPFPRNASDEQPHGAAAKGGGFWSRAFRAVVTARQREAERYVARLVERRAGGPVSDLEGWSDRSSF